MDSIIQAIDFIEENLKYDINVQDVANRACYSLYHFIRLFNGVTGHTPKDYILRRRISEAFKELTQTSKKIIEVCFDYQFGSPEVFSRAFKRVMGIKPGELKKMDYYSGQSLLTPINKDSIIHGKNLRETEVEEVFLDEIELMGMVTLIREDKTIIDELWSYMAKEFSYFKDLEDPGYYGLSYWSNDYDLGGFFLLCGIPFYNIKAEAPLCTRKIPHGRYLKFVHKGNIQNISLTYKHIFQSYLPKTDYTLSKPFDFELYHPNEKGPHASDAVTDILIPID